MSGTDKRLLNEVIAKACGTKRCDVFPRTPGQEVKWQPCDLVAGKSGNKEGYVPQIDAVRNSAKESDRSKFQQARTNAPRMEHGRNNPQRESEEQISSLVTENVYIADRVPIRNTPQSTCEHQCHSNGIGHPGSKPAYRPGMNFRFAEQKS